MVVMFLVLPVVAVVVVVVVVITRCGITSTRQGGVVGWQVLRSGCANKSFF